jgi:hypothetical protein
LEETVAAPVKKTENTTGGIRCADHATSSIRKMLALTSPTSGGRSVGIVRSRTKATKLLLVIYFINDIIMFKFKKAQCGRIYSYNCIRYTSRLQIFRPISTKIIEKVYQENILYRMTATSFEGLHELAVDKRTTQTHNSRTQNNTTIWHCKLL